MKGRKMKQMKKVLMGGLAAGMLMTSVQGAAGVSPWATTAIGAVASLAGAALSEYNAPRVILMPGTLNVDAVQLALEYMVLKTIKDIKDDWDPEPADEYQKAAEENGGSGGCGAGGVTYDSAVQTLPFEVASLENVGIEAIGVGPSVSEIMSARETIFQELAWLQPAGSGGSNGIESGAGSCSASYSVCLRDMTAEEESAVGSLQKVNGQDYGTAGIAHAELGLKAVQQAMVNDGDNVVKTADAGISSHSADTVLLGTGKASVQDLKKLIGTGKNTVAAMKIVALMNLELAQRLNQGNMMQGATLTIEAARAFPKTIEITK